MPCIWYESHLSASDTGLHTSGVQIPGFPCTIIGHNENVCAGVTLGYTDTEDLFVERFISKTVKNLPPLASTPRRIPLPLPPNVPAVLLSTATTGMPVYLIVPLLLVALLLSLRRCWRCIYIVVPSRWGGERSQHA